MYPATWVPSGQEGLVFPFLRVEKMLAFRMKEQRIKSNFRVRRAERCRRMGETDPEGKTGPKLYEDAGEEKVFDFNKSRKRVVKRAPMRAHRLK